MFLYRLRIVQELIEQDYKAHIEISSWCLENIELDALFLNCVIFPDKYILQVDGKVNEHDVVIWESENFNKTREGPKMVRK